MYTNIPEIIVADKAYSGEPTKEVVEQDLNARLVAPEKGQNKNSDEEKELLKNRYKVERTNAWKKSYRKCLIRWEKYIDNFLGWIQLSFIHKMIGWILYKT